MRLRAAQCEHVVYGPHVGCAVRAGGEVWCRGRGQEGQVGHGFVADSLPLVKAQLPCPVE